MKYTGLELIKNLCDVFGPSGCEDKVAQFILEQIQGDCDSVTTDRAGNIIAKVSGRGLEYNEDEPRKVMISAHMDEVGVMISDITEDGYLKFATVGGITPAALIGKRVVIMNEKYKLDGVIASRTIHTQTAEERGRMQSVSEMHIDIGADSEQEAREYIDIGDVGVFAPETVYFGDEDKLIRSKALDDRLGCAMGIEIMRRLYHSTADLEYDVYFAFTRCEEIGISSALVATYECRPDIAIIIESTAVADIAGVPESSNVAKLGQGGVISFMDRSTIYDKRLVDIALQMAENKGIKAQIKRFISGGNDAGGIQRTAEGVRVLAVSAPSRYIHSASNVIHTDDYFAMLELIHALVADGKI